VKEVVMKVEGYISDVVQLVQAAATAAEEVYYDGDRQAWVARPKPPHRILEELGIESIEGVEA